jgi:hypothetical protein
VPQTLPPSAGSWVPHYHCQERNLGRDMVGRLLATVLTGCTRTFSYPSKGCERLQPWDLFMSIKTAVTVNVTFDVAATVRWICLLLSVLLM